MIVEPPWPILKQPIAGWSKASYRLDLSFGTTFDEAVYELTAASRELRRGVVASFDGVDLVAFPHQTIAEVARSSEGMIAMARRA